MVGLFVLMGCLSNFAHASALVVKNQTLAVQYAPTSHEFTLTDRTARQAVLTHGHLLDLPVQQARVGPVADRTFGRGHQISIHYTDGSKSSLELYRDLPFLLIRTEQHNATTAEIDTARVVPIQFQVDLGRPTAELRTLGTAGLTAPDRNPGSYLFLTLADPATRRGVVAGWLSQDRASGVWFSTNRGDRVEFQGRLDYGHLRIPAGDRAALETVAVGVFADARLGEEAYADAVARQYAIRLHPQVSGYCTWYSNPHGGAADEKSIVELAEVASRELRPYGFSFVQIDDQWQDGKERNGPARRFLRAKPNGPYSHGLAPVCARLENLGLTTGLWFLPFASDYQDSEFKDHPNWFVKRTDGRPYETAWGNTSLDLTHPEVQSYLSEMVRTIHSWGVNYFKMDGLWTGSATEQIYVNDGYHEDNIGNNAPFFDRRKTNVEVLRSGLKLLRDAAGPEVFFSGCNLSQNMRSLAGCLGLVDSMRIGPDNGQSWRDYREEIAKNDCGSIITGPVRGTRLYFMHGRLWWNDPDPCYVRASIPLKHAQLITSWVGLSGQFNLNSDWIPGLPPERLSLLKRVLPSHGATARPIDYFDSIMPSLWQVTDQRSKVRRDVIGLFNWDSREQTYACAAARAGLDPAGNYFAFDFWADRPVAPFTGQFQWTVPAQSCRAIAVRAAAGHPVLVSTSRHITQGMVDVKEEKWSSSSRRLSGTSRLVGGDSYQLRIAGLQAGEKHFRLVSASVADADAAAAVTISAAPVTSEEPGWLRVNLSCPESREVHWELRFAVN